MIAINNLQLILSSPHDKLLRKAIETVYKAHNIDIKTFDFKNSIYSDIDDLLLNRVPTNVIDFDPAYFLEYLQKTTVEPLEKLNIWVILPTDISLCDRVMSSLRFAIELKIPIYFFLPKVSDADWTKIVPNLSPESRQIIRQNHKKSSYFTPIKFDYITHLSGNGIYTSLMRSTYRRSQVLSSNILELLESVSTILNSSN